MLHKRLAIAVLSSSVIFIGAACTPEEVAVFKVLPQEQQQAIIEHLNSGQEANPFDTSSNKELGLQIALEQGESEASFNCANAVVMGESKWIVDADNPNSSAYGIPQALPGSKMVSHGSDWRTNPRTQIRWMYDYMRGRYGSFCGALKHKKATGWY